MVFDPLLNMPTRVLALSTSYMYFGIALAVIIAILIILFIIVSNNKKNRKPLFIDDKTIDEMIQNLGGITNILAATKDGARLSFKVKSINQCKLDTIKSQGALGIFVTGTTIKMMLPYDATQLIYRINQLLKGEN